MAIARWKQLAPGMAKHERDEDLMNAWAAWRGLAAQALSAGAQDARAFLAEQVATPKIDRGVKRTCERAIAAIDKRTHQAAGQCRPGRIRVNRCSAENQTKRPSQ